MSQKIIRGRILLGCPQKFELPRLKSNVEYLQVLNFEVEILQTLSFTVLLKYGGGGCDSFHFKGLEPLKNHSISGS
ncbi:hypothetical protein QYF36_000179 [Acer negundo]|nr:hypothetical protein QYF36_000179 [Acer negundo]